MLSTVQGEAYEAPEVSNLKDESQKIVAARQWMSKNFFYIRTFGAVMSLKTNNCGQVRGPVQINFSRSIEPVIPRELSITRMAVATEEEAKSQKGDNRTMGRKSIIPYGLYRTEGYISAHLAKQTGFSEEDLELLWESIINMFEHDRSAARGKMAARKLFVFKHESSLGNAPAHKLFDLISIKRVGDSSAPARSFADYEVLVDLDKKPSNVNLIEML